MPSSAIYFIELIRGKVCYDFYDQPQRTSQISYRLANIGALGTPIKARLCDPVVRLAIVRRVRVQPCVFSEKVCDEDGYQVRSFLLEQYCRKYHFGKYHCGTGPRYDVFAVYPLSKVAREMTVTERTVVNDIMGFIS